MEALEEVVREQDLRIRQLEERMSHVEGLMSWLCIAEALPSRPASRHPAPEGRACPGHARKHLLMLAEVKDPPREPKRPSAGGPSQDEIEAAGMGDEENSAPDIIVSPLRPLRRTMMSPLGDASRQRTASSEQGGKTGHTRRAAQRALVFTAAKVPSCYLLVLSRSLVIL